MELQTKLKNYERKKYLDTEDEYLENLQHTNDIKLLDNLSLQNIASFSVILFHSNLFEKKLVGSFLPKWNNISKIVAVKNLTTIVLIDEKEEHEVFMNFILWSIIY